MSCIHNNIHNYVKIPDNIKTTHFQFILIYYRNKAKGSETMSQWILIALFLLAHPLMMLFMHKGMHGGSGSMGGCGNNTQQNSNNTEKPRKKVN
jgi:hypothetical protein